MSLSPLAETADSKNGKSDDNFEEALFVEVLQELQMRRVGDFVISVRNANKWQAQRQDGVAAEGCNNSAVTIADPLYGSFNVGIPVSFSDDTKWLLKIPANGTRKRFDVPSQRALLSEARTMQSIKKRTTIPIPAVLTYDASVNNILHCPFILMEFVVGIPAYNCWFNKRISEDILKARRMQCLKDIASAMVQLSSFAFDQGGSLLFDEKLGPVEVGPFRYVDNLAMLDRVFKNSDDSDDSSDDDSTVTSITGSFVDLGKREQRQKNHVKKREQREEPEQKQEQKGDDLFAIYVEAGPTLYTQDYYTFMLDRQRKAYSNTQIGSRKLLRYFIDWLPEPKDEFAKRKPFVLAHPDLNFQNVIVSEDGYLQGLIDWDGVISVPRSLGNESYPNWLTRDWDPAMYGYTSDMAKGIEPVGVWEDSPETLAFYRSVYEEYLRSAYCRNWFDAIKQVHNAAEVTLTKIAKCNTTRRSLLAENIYYAVSDPVCTNGVLMKIFDELAKRVKSNFHLSKDRVSTDVASSKDVRSPSFDENISRPTSEEHAATSTAKTEREDFNFYDVCWDLGTGELDEERWQYLRKGFELLLDSV